MSLPLRGRCHAAGVTEGVICYYTSLEKVINNEYESNFLQREMLTTSHPCFAI